MLQPMECEIECQDGTKKTFILSKFPAIAGREILTQYPVTAMPKIGEYASNEKLMLKVMGYVAVPTEAEPLLLSSRNMVDNHVPDWECLARLEIEMLRYNWAFFQNGGASNFFEVIIAKALPLIIKTWTDYAAQSSPAVKLRSGS